MSTLPATSTSVSPSEELLDRVRDLLARSSTCLTFLDRFSIADASSSRVCVCVSLLACCRADESMFPTKAGQPTATNFENPTAPVHFLTGNGGPPSIDRFPRAATFSHTRSTKFGCVLYAPSRAAFARLFVCRAAFPSSCRSSNTSTLPPSYSKCPNEINQWCRNGAAGMGGWRSRMQAISSTSRF
jgi:hypothetical protein